MSESEKSLVVVPECVKKVCDAWADHVAATDEYNKEWAEVKRRQAFNDWGGDLAPEFHKMNETGNAYSQAVKDMIAEITPLLSTPTPPSAEQSYASDILFNGVSAGRVPEGLELIFFVDGDEDECHTKICVNEYGIICLLRSLKFFGCELSNPVEQPDSAAPKQEAVGEVIADSISISAALNGKGYRTLNVGDKLYAQPSTAHKPQRITEQDAREIATEFYFWWHNQPGKNTMQGFNEWVSCEIGHTLIAKLNEHREPDYRAHRDEIPNEWRVTKFGQVKAGDALSFDIGGDRICTTAKEILNAGTTSEEVIYNRKKNHYFITGMVLDGTSTHKNVFIVPNPAIAKASTSTDSGVD